jgi:hypothetical protein
MVGDLDGSQTTNGSRPTARVGTRRSCPRTTLGTPRERPRMPGTGASFPEPGSYSLPAVRPAGQYSSAAGRQAGWIEPRSRCRAASASPRSARAIPPTRSSYLTPVAAALRLHSRARPCAPRRSRRPKAAKDAISAAKPDSSPSNSTKAGGPSLAHRRATCCCTRPTRRFCATPRAESPVVPIGHVGLRVLGHVRRRRALAHGSRSRVAMDSSTATIASSTW